MASNKSIKSSDPVTNVVAEKSHLIHQATDQIRAMADVLRAAAAHQRDTETLPILVLALTPRLIELADALSCAELNAADDIDPVPEFRAVLFGRQTVDAGVHHGN